MTTFSVLICTCNRPSKLRLSLSALIDKTLEKPDQVIVVNGGDECSDPIVLGYTDRPGIEVELVKTVNKNLATSRNTGLVRCTGEIVAMTDDDAEVFPDWVTQMKKVHTEHPEAGGVGGAVLGADSNRSLLSRIADIATFSSPSQPGYMSTIAGVNVSYKRSILLAVGPQDEALFRGEDVDFNWRIKKLGYEIYYSPDIKVLHYHRPNLKQFINQFFMYGRAFYLVRRKWPEMYCMYPHQISRLKDVLKLLYFTVSTLIDPFISAMKMATFVDRILAIPVLYALHIAWKSGILIQKLESHPKIP